MTIMSSRLIRHEICKEDLKALGATVVDIQGIMFLAKFEIKGNVITYAYHLNEDETYFLERIKPYFVAVGNFQTEESIVEAIKIDIEQFKNAMCSKQYPRFVEMDQHLSELVRYFEDLYLYYNIDAKDLEALDESISEVLKHIKRIMKKSPRVYTQKDPDVLKDDIEF